MNCLKSQNQCINTVMFPGSIAPSSYHPESFLRNHNTRLIYIPFKRPDCFPCAYAAAAPTHIPAILAINPSLSANLFCIHFHGNACDIGQIAVCAQREGNAFNAHYLLVEYPSFGFCNGYPNEVVMDEVAIVAHQFVVREFLVPSSQVVLIGRSIGTGPACSLASYLQQLGTPPLAVILQSPFSSIRDAASDLLGCVSFFMLDRWPNWQRLVGSGSSVIRCPVLFLHADMDKIIKVSHSMVLHEQRQKFDLPSELFIQRSNDRMIKGHNFFDYERDVVQPGRDFLLRRVAELQSGGVRLTAIKIPSPALELAVVVPLEYAKSRENDAAEHMLQSGSPPAPKKTSWGKCDRLVQASWCCCPCVFCTEAMCACTILSVRECCIISHLYTPVMDYKRLRPQDGSQGSLYNLLVRKKSFERIQNQEELARNAKKTEVVNPLNAAAAKSASAPALATAVAADEDDFPTATIIHTRYPSRPGTNKGLDYVPG